MGDCLLQVACTELSSDLRLHTLVISVEPNDCDVDSRELQERGRCKVQVMSKSHDLRNMINTGYREILHDFRGLSLCDMH